MPSTVRQTSVGFRFAATVVVVDAGLGEAVVEALGAEESAS
jgi:hypothetical protein